MLIIGPNNFPIKWKLIFTDNIELAFIGQTKLKILEDKAIVGEFIANSGKIVDTFEIRKGV